MKLLKQISVQKYQKHITQNLTFTSSVFVFRKGRRTVRKRRDPAILDREEQVLKLKIEEIFFSEEFSNPNFKDHS